MEEIVLTTLGLGFALGLAHACDPDHVVAVGTLAAESESVKRSSLLGLFWGIGHTMALALIGGVLLSLKLTIPEHLAMGIEVIVAGMIIFLGGSLIWHSIQGLTVHSHPHSHGGSTHVHLHIHHKETSTHHHHGLSSCRKAFAVGVIHGMAGSAVLSLAVMTTLPSTLLGLTYIFVFGVGSIGGMLIMSAVMSLPFVLIAGYLKSWQERIKVLAGLFAVGFGGYLGWTLLS